MSRKLRADELRVIHSDHVSDTAKKPSPEGCAISVKNATLEYPVGKIGQGSLKAKLLSLLGHREPNPSIKTITAFRDVSFEFSYGERVAVIGRNGAGKSSILRALAGVYPLEAGDITVTGQIGTLLDIGLGFEPEATGRENIYYRGMAMGYSRVELKAVEQEIIDFADLGTFIDLPVRTYSSGMYVRLGFAVSTQFAPDVLLIDEVFGAGDASFAARAIRRMESIVSESGIMIIATHDMPLAEKFCTRVIWMEGGQIRMDGEPKEVVPLFKEAALID